MFQEKYSSGNKCRAIAAVVFVAGLTTSGVVMAEATVIELTQTGCQFLEPEAKDHNFNPASAEQCKIFNEQSGKDRLAGVEPLILKSGKHIFRVTNEDVPYELGFWLRGNGFLRRLSLPSVSGGGLTKGATHDYEVELIPGEYVYSCPLNPTLDYPVVVKG
jgi:hypothetical protein